MSLICRVKLLSKLERDGWMDTRDRRIKSSEYKK